uniref:Uncharacterized protein n=1 Tax=Bionectria ochroleuca TaxID=29856 RepID=A0A8H7K8K7_BIOOC
MAVRMQYSQAKGRGEAKLPGGPVELRGLASNVNQLRVHIMVPFFDCFALPNAFNGKCANCLFRTYGDCEHEYLDYRPVDSAEELAGPSLFLGESFDLIDNKPCPIYIL